MTQRSFTRPDIGFAVDPCNLQGLLQFNQTRFETSLKLCFPIREWLTRCQGSENLPTVSRRLSTKVLLLHSARGTEGSPRLTAPILLTILLPIHPPTSKHCGHLAGKC